jgi:hypothetical protein
MSFSNKVTINAGDMAIGDVGIDQTTPGTTNAVVPIQLPVSPINISGTITTGGAAQVLSAAKPNGRLGFEIYNPDLTYSLFFSVTTTAVTDSPSQEIAPGKQYSSPDGLVTTGAISIISSQTGHVFTAVEW